jgi:hypothetical protein
MRPAAMALGVVAMVTVAGSASILLQAPTPAAARRAAASATASPASATPQSTPAASTSPAGTAKPTPTSTPASRPRCFGAQSRDPLAPCTNPRLRPRVTPTPAQARAPVVISCDIVGKLASKEVCAFGGEDGAQRTIALVGDSHAGNWRWALTDAMRAFQWRGLRIGHASCPLSTAVRDLPEPNRSSCARWKRAVFAYLRRHREISVVISSQLSGGSGVVPSRGRSAFETAVAGYRRAWRRLPASVERIVVIRDAPKAERWTADCVERAIAARRPAGPRCANTRREALDADPAATAARRSRDPRVVLIDMTAIFCGERRCYPVIGGALVHRDTTHLTKTFAQSLSVPLLRRLEP